MRTRQWLASLLSGCLAVAGGLSAQAQTPPFPQYGPGNPDAVGMLPPPYNSNYGTVPQSYTGMEQAGYPPGANAWPNVSPYMGPAMDQTTYEDGNWFNRQFTGNRKYYLSTEALIGSTQRGDNTRIGAYGVNVIPPSPGIYVVDHNQLFFETARSVIDNMPNRFVGTGGTPTATGDVPIFVERYFHDMPDPNQSAGIRATWGWFNPDQSGFQMSGFWLGNAKTSYFSGTGLPFDPTDALIYQNIGYIEDRLRAFSGLPLQGADSDGDGRPGFVMPFDIYYRMQFETQLTGASVDWFWSSIYDKSNVMIRPVGGARFLQIRERFTFNGSDSGMGYAITPARTTTGGTTTGAGRVYAPEAYPANFDPEFLIPDVMNSHLTAGSRSILGGPEAGLRFDLGSDGFKVWAQSKFGLLANHTNRDLSGFNIGDAYYVANGRTTTVMPRNNPALTSFSSQDSSTWISPMFEQSIFMKAPLFQFVPVLNKARCLNQAEFQAGYTLLVVGQVARPDQQINWQAYPVNPQLQHERSTYTNGTWSLGVEWAY